MRLWQNWTALFVMINNFNDIYKVNDKIPYYILFINITAKPLIVHRVAAVYPPATPLYNLAIIIHSIQIPHHKQTILVAIVQPSTSAHLMISAVRSYCITSTPLSLTKSCSVQHYNTVT